MTDGSPAALGPFMTVFPLALSDDNELGGLAVCVAAAARATASTGRVLSLLLTTDWAPGQKRIVGHPRGTCWERVGEGYLGRAYHRCEWVGPKASTSVCFGLVAGVAQDIGLGRVLYQASLFYPPAIVHAALAAAQGGGLVVAPHGELGAWALARGALRKRVVLALWRRLLKGGRAVVHATSEAEAATIRQHFGATTPVCLIPNGLVEIPPMMSREEGRALSETPIDARVVMYLGRLNPIKNLEALITAFAHLHEAGRAETLWIVGDEDSRGYRKLLEQHSAEHGLEGSLRFFPHTVGRDKELLYAAADLFCLPSHTENFGMVVIEALAQGCPVVASRGTPWGLLESAGCGRWVEGTPPSLAAAMGDILAAPVSERAAMRERGRRLVEREFLLESLADRYIDMYEEALRRADAGGKGGWRAPVTPT